jgi:hypothetical protein
LRARYGVVAAFLPPVPVAKHKAPRVTEPRNSVAG